MDLIDKSEIVLAGGSGEGKDRLVVTWRAVDGKAPETKVHPKYSPQLLNCRVRPPVIHEPRTWVPG